jgi:hypothetical protein
MENEMPGWNHDTVTASGDARHEPAAATSERRFLGDQIAQAKMAMLQTLDEIKETAIRSADVRSRARQHPWLVTGSALAAGFVASAAFTHARRRATGSMPAPAEATGEPVPGERKPSNTGTESWFAFLSTALITAVVPLLQGALTAGVVSLFGKEEVEGAPPAADEGMHKSVFRNGAD